STTSPPSYKSNEPAEVQLLKNAPDCLACRVIGTVLRGGVGVYTLYMSRALHQCMYVCVLSIGSFWPPVNLSVGYQDQISFPCCQCTSLDEVGYVPGRPGGMQNHTDLCSPGSISSDSMKIPEQLRFINRQ
ncbi:hypothetical protein FKP32DRAFT_1558102, partial [Trametes sanguinea]